MSKVADTVFAFSPGIVDQVTVQPGDFVQEGDLLATCVSQQSMRVVVSIPLEEDVTHFQNTGRQEPGCLHGTFDSIS